MSGFPAGQVLNFAILQPLVDGRNEPVAAARDGFDKPRRVGRVPESVTQPLDNDVQTVLKIDEGVFWPEPLSQLLTSDELAGVLEQQCERLKRLLLQVDARARLSKLA